MKTEELPGPQPAGAPAPALDPPPGDDLTAVYRPPKGRLFWQLLLSQAFCLVWVLVHLISFDIAWRLGRPVSLGVVWAIQEAARGKELPMGTDPGLVGAALFMALFFCTIVGFQWVTLRGALLMLLYLPLPRENWPFDLTGLRLARVGVVGAIGAMTLAAAILLEPWVPASRCISCGHVPAAIIGGVFAAFTGPVLVWWLRSPAPTTQESSQDP